MSAENPRPVVFLVDDDLETANMYRLGLIEAGWRPVIVPDVSALFNELDDQVPDSLVLDWQLEGMTGGDVLRVLRSDPRTSNLPVLFLSNHLPPNSYVEADLTGSEAFAWLVKSRTSPAQLAKRLAEGRPSVQRAG